MGFQLLTVLFSTILVVVLFVSQRSAKRYKYYGTRASTDLAMDAAQRCIEGRSSASVERSLLIEKIGLHDQGIEVFDECLRINRVPGGVVINAKGHDRFCALLWTGQVLPH